MAAIREQKFHQQAILLDGQEYVACEFHDCRMIYQGGSMPQLQSCHFIRCTWHLEEAALRTVRFLRGIYHSGPGGRDLVEETLRHIRIKG